MSTGSRIIGALLAGGALLLSGPTAASAEPSSRPLPAEAPAPPGKAESGEPGGTVTVELAGP